MSQPKKESDSEPSMKEILASIRKIISEDQQESIVENSNSLKEGINAAGNPSDFEEFNSDDVLELTEVVMDSSGNEVGPNDPSLLPNKLDEEPSHGNAVFNNEIQSGDDLVDVESARSATSSLALLADAVSNEKATLSIGNGNQTVAVSNEKARLSIGNGNQTVEDLIKEVMRPMVKDWLDKNLPDLVERLVKTEIERITRDL